MKFMFLHMRMLNEVVSDSILNYFGHQRRLDIGRKLEYCSWSALGFLRAGCNSATLKGSGISPEESDTLTIRVIIGSSVSKQPLIMTDHTGSSL